MARPAASVLCPEALEEKVEEVAWSAEAEGSTEHTSERCRPAAALPGEQMGILGFAMSVRFAQFRFHTATTDSTSPFRLRTCKSCTCRVPILGTELGHRDTYSSHNHRPAQCMCCRPSRRTRPRAGKVSLDKQGWGIRL